MARIIKACARCGSTNLRMRSVVEGLIPYDITSASKLICNDCNYIGIPLIFDCKEDYENFKKGIRRE